MFIRLLNTTRNLFFLLIRRPPSSTPFPYTTLFRSRSRDLRRSPGGAGGRVPRVRGPGPACRRGGRKGAFGTLKIALLGVGLIGGSIGLAARERIDGATVRGFDPDEEALARAVELGAIDEPSAPVEEALAGAEACFACAPVGQLGELVREALEHGGDCVVSDVGSTKRSIIDGLTISGLGEEDL